MLLVTLQVKHHGAAGYYYFMYMRKKKQSVEFSVTCEDDYEISVLKQNEVIDQKTIIGHMRYNFEKTENERWQVTVSIKKIRETDNPVKITITNEDNRVIFSENYGESEFNVTLDNIIPN